MHEYTFKPCLNYSHKLFFISETDTQSLRLYTAIILIVEFIHVQHETDEYPVHVNGLHTRMT